MVLTPEQKEFLTPAMAEDEHDLTTTTLHLEHMARQD